MRYVVFTTIAAPTLALIKWSELAECKLIGVGDRKTPPGWRLTNCQFISTVDQETSGCSLTKILPWNHYTRKMIGYVEAIRQGAEIIVDTDDDNEPKADWDVLAFDGKFEVTAPGPKWFNAYKLFCDSPIWPRGYPLNRILETQPSSELARESVNVGIWQGLADEDPDVDAIYRLTRSGQVYFKQRSPVVLAEGSVCPFNSQNTAYRKELFPLLYLPATVSFRFTDILRSLVAQPLMWHYGYRLGFTNATVVQKRNPHDYMADFKSELPMYLHGESIPDIVQQSIFPSETLAHNLRSAYVALAKLGIVTAEEILILTAWLSEIKT